MLNSWWVSMSEFKSFQVWKGLAVLVGSVVALPLVVLNVPELPSSISTSLMMEEAGMSVVLVEYGEKHSVRFDGYKVVATEPVEFSHHVQDVYERKGCTQLCAAAGGTVVYAMDGAPWCGDEKVSPRWKFDEESALCRGSDCRAGRFADGESADEFVPPAASELARMSCSSQRPVRLSRREGIEYLFK